MMQRAWEAKALAIVDSDDDDESSDDRTTKVQQQLAELAAAAVADWWALDDDLTLRFGDGWEHEWATPAVAGEDGGGVVAGASRCRPIAYPDSWLEKVGFVSNAPPKATVWTVGRKLEEVEGNLAERC